MQDHVERLRPPVLVSSNKSTGIISFEKKIESIMAKRRKCAEAAEEESDTKKLKRAVKGESRGAKKREKKKDTVNDDTEEKLERKVHPKPRFSSKRAAKSSSSANVGTDVKTSKYFASPLKEEVDSEDDFNMVTSAPPVVNVSAKELAREEEKEEDDSEDGDDWEEVEELAEPLGPVDPPEPVLPSQPLEIEIETAEARKQKKRQAEVDTYLRRMMKRFKKDLLIDTHKVHILCLVANGMFRNRLCSQPDLLAITLSLLPSHFCAVAKERIDQNYLSGLLKWFKATFTLNPSLSCEERLDPQALLERRLASLSAKDHQEMTHIFLLILRSLQLFCRLVLSLQPVPFKPPSAKCKGARKSTSAPERCQSQETSKTNSAEPKASRSTKRPPGGGKTKSSTVGKGRGKETEEEKEEKPVSSGGQRPKNSKRRSVASKVSYKEDSNSEGEGDDEELSDAEEFQATSEGDSEDSESEAESSKRKTGKAKRKARSTNNKNATTPKRRSGGKKRKSSEDDSELEESKGDDEDEGVACNKSKRQSGRSKEGPGADEWIEVYVNKTSSWVCVDVQQGVGVPHLCSQNATAPLTYVVAVDGNGFLKDLGRKYDPTWMTSSRKRRVDDEWWEETLQPFLGPEDERDKKEEKELQDKLLNKPLPISVAEYKNHPLYALKRHLLKYEALYPSTATVLGYCRGEPVYSRDCVHTLHSRELWLKEARTVRIGEEPFKMVKGFSNRSRKARMMSETKDEKDLPLFGEWQTEEYQPPIAVDGKVPRNEYGNVYLFKACMIPVGCVHVRLPNLHRVARKLNLDAVPAVTGFDYHGGYSHAVTDGYIVCEEDEEILRAAWVEEQEIQKQKQKEKKEKRAIGNWALLVKGLLIKERLKKRYNKKPQGLGNLAHEDDAGGFSSDEEVVEGDASGAKTASETLAMSWPQNRQAEEEDRSGSRSKRKTTRRGKKSQEKHLFPFEKV
ncbi:DNA repair protein complementing XP-C cells [Austrofundulus limnaeus]|uniref:DNA repair protein complementing XP-C cells n=1 Tax=Austrofundulus limnaeus TaxID=52670 RepID=A0A2I4AP04_AUSLI|nr:PREDICTED: DNA repair protein complementing XP-C cells [Austrofundulus limnaeus]